MSKSKNRVGRNSLIISILGLIIVQALITTGYLHNQYWYILLAGFEAATIGGFADWFAVNALFHEIPIPIVRKHTNIIVRNRIKLTEGVVDLVTNKWLSPEIIKEKIADIPILKSIVTTLQEPHNTTKVIDFLKVVAGRITSNMDNPDVAKIFQSILKDQIKDIDFATPLGEWVKNAITNGDHQQLWETLLNSAEKTINDPKTSEVLLKLVSTQMAEYKDEGLSKRLLMGFAKGVGAIDNASIAEKIVNSVKELISEAKDNPDHPVRASFDKNILNFAEQLIEGQEESVQMVKSIQDKLVNGTDANNVLQTILANLKGSFSEQLQKKDTPFSNFLQQNVEKLLNELSTDEETQLKVDIWIKDSIGQLLGKYHHEVGEMVRFSLSKLDDNELVNQIEEKVGNDLQFIRLNGAVVGGFVGLVIATIRLIIQ